MEERQRVKIVDYVGSKKIETSKIDEKLKEANAADPARHLHRSRPDPQGRRHRPRHDEGEGLPVRRRHARDQGDAGRPEAGAPHVQHRRRARRSRSAAIDFVGNKAISDGTLQAQMKENKERGGYDPSLPTWSWRSAAGTYQEAKFDEDAEKIVVVLPRPRLHQGATSARPSEGPRATRTDKKTRWIELRIPVTEGQRYKVGELRLRRQHGRQDRVPAAAVQAEAGRVLQREEDPQGPREGARGLRRRRLLRVHRLSRLQVPRRAEPSRAAGARGARRRRSRPRRPAGPPIVDVTMRMQEGAAVLRQPHHLHRQHDDARQRHPARDAAGRGRRVQHRSAEVQHQAAESARLLQAARGRQGRQRREDAERRRTRSTSS